MRMHFREGITERNIIVRCGADKLLPFALTFGLYIIIYGTVSPGGGFQGGVTVASAILFLYLAYGYDRTAWAVKPEILRINEAVGASIYVLLALAGILVGMNFCRNFLFDIGAVGDVISAGTITFMGYTVGYKVLTGVGFLLILMLSLLGPDSTKEVLAFKAESDAPEPVYPGIDAPKYDDLKTAKDAAADKSSSKVQEEA